MSNKWDTISKPERIKLLRAAGLPEGLSQLKWSGLQKSERKKLEGGSGWFEAKKPVKTNKGIELLAPEHHKVAIKKAAGKALNTPMERKEEKKVDNGETELKSFDKALRDESEKAEEQTEKIPNGYKLVSKDYQREKYEREFMKGGVDIVVAMQYHTTRHYWHVNILFTYEPHFRTEVVDGLEYTKSRKEARDFAYNAMRKNPEEYYNKLSDYYKNLIIESLKKPMHELESAHEEKQEESTKTTEEPKIRDTKIKNVLYQRQTYRQAIEDSISNMEVELKGGRVRADSKRFTYQDKDNSLMSDPVYETKFWLEAYHDGRLVKLPLNRAEVDYYNKLKSEYKKPEPAREVETPERTRFYLQDRVDTAKKALRDLIKMNDTAMIKKWEGYLAEREKELAEFDATKKETNKPERAETHTEPTRSNDRGITWDVTFRIGIPQKDGSTKGVNKSMTDLKVSSHQEVEAEVLKKYPKAYYIHVTQNIPSSARGAV